MTTRIPLATHKTTNQTLLGKVSLATLQEGCEAQPEVHMKE